MQSTGNRHTQAGDTLLTSLLFLFVLAGTLRLCFNQTLHESKLSSIFIQETQAYYIMENMMAMTRDYIYQLTQNPRYPCIFFGVDAFKRKGTGKLFTLNTDVFAKTQIVPDGFPLKIKDSGWDLKVGPIFWQDKTGRDSGRMYVDTRYFSETFMLGALQIDSALVPDWTLYMAQTFEIERNPLCDFSLYAEGDLTITANRSATGMAYDRLAQINGNARILRYSTGSSSTITFPKFSIAGHAYRVTNATSSSVQLPTKYGMRDNYSLYNYKLRLPNASGAMTYKMGGTDLGTFLNMANSNGNETSLFGTYRNNFIPRARVYRPSGFDPIGDAAFWTPGENVGSASLEKVWDYTVGFRMLTREWNKETVNANSSRVASAGSTLRGFNVKQINERIRIVQSQQIMCFPGIEIRALLKTKDKVNTASLDVVNNFPYVTYMSSTFPATNDNLYLSRFFTLRTQNETVFYDNCVNLQYEKGNYDYVMDSTGSSSVNVPSEWLHQSIVNNKLVVSSTNQQQLFAANAAPFLKYKSEYPVTSYTDTRYPPHKLIDCGDHWEEDTSARTRIVDDARYNFLYDRNRGKWIQVVDFDVGAFMSWCESNASTWEKAQRTLKFNIYWAGSTQNANRNYIINNSDIRNNYPANHQNFISNANNLNGGYTYARGSNPPVIDVGIRLVNADWLYKTGNKHNYGITIVCPYPLYIQGNFNATYINYSTLIVADSITLLSNNFGDWSSSMNPSTSYLRNTSPTRPFIYANIITGRTHPNYWPVNNTGIYPDFGIHDMFRTLEPFSTPIAFRGSIMLPYYSMEQWEPPIDFNPKRTPAGYGPADIAFSGNNMKSTESIPTYLKINRGRKTMMLGKTTYDALVEKFLESNSYDPATYTFKTYHNTDLPNYLKLDKDM